MRRLSDARTPDVHTPPDDTAAAASSSIVAISAGEARTQLDERHVRRWVTNEVLRLPAGAQPVHPLVSLFVVVPLFGVPALVAFLRRNGMPIDDLTPVLLAIVAGLVGSISFLLLRRQKHARDEQLAEWLAGVSESDRARLAEAYESARVRLLARGYPHDAQYLSPDDLVKVTLEELTRR